MITIKMYGINNIKYRKL